MAALGWCPCQQIEAGRRHTQQRATLLLHSQIPHGLPARDACNRSCSQETTCPPPHTTSCAYCTTRASCCAASPRQARGARLGGNVSLLLLPWTTHMPLGEPACCSALLLVALPCPPSLWMEIDCLQHHACFAVACPDHPCLYPPPLACRISTPWSTWQGCPPRQL